MIELESCACRATVSGFARIRALSSVTLPDRALDVRGDVTRARRVTAPATARLIGRRELLLLELLDQRIERLLDDRRDVS